MWTLPAQGPKAARTSGHRLWLNPEVWLHQAVLKPHSEWEPKWMAHNILVGKMLLHWISEPRHLLCLCFCVSSQTIYLHIAASCCIRSCSETQVQRKEKNNKKVKKTLQRYVWILLEINEEVKYQNCRRHEISLTMGTASLFYITEKNGSNARCTVT